MRIPAASLLLLVVGSGCGMMMMMPPPTPPPPQVFLVVDEANVIGSSVKGQTTTSGCDKVTQVRLYGNDVFLADAFWKQNPTPFELIASQLKQFYGESLAASVVLTAEVVCEDGRSNKSQPVGISFFPVASVTSASQGQALPDTFIAEGGLNGTATTFLGCTGGLTDSVVRMDTSGNVIQSNNSVPFCTQQSVFSDRALATGTRWVMEKNKGIYAIDSRALSSTPLQVSSVFVSDKIQEMAVAPDGDAIVYVDSVAAPVVYRLRPGQGSMQAAIRWSYTINIGIVNATPVIDTANRWVYVSQFEFNMGTRVGAVIVYKFNYDTGQMIIPNGILIWQQTFPDLEVPVLPLAQFKADGSLIYLPLVASGTTGTVQSLVYACATDVSGCTGQARRWASAPMAGVMQYALAFSNGNYLAVTGANATQFLNAGTGAIVTKDMAPIVPEGSLVTTGIQPGLATDFYVLQAPSGGYPTKLIAFDDPSKSELWHLSFGGGEAASTGLWMAVDEAGTVWLRVGVNNVKPLSNAEYRLARGG